MKLPFWPVPVEQEIDGELAAHLELQVRRYVDAGMSEAEARAEALRRFGDVERVREECRSIRHQMEDDVRKSELREDLAQDVRFATRVLRANPVYTVVALLTLAIGIGANTAVFSVVNAALLRALPYRHADRVVAVWNIYRHETTKPFAVSPAEYADLRERSQAFDALAAVRPQSSSLTGEGEPEELPAYVVSPNLFDLLGAHPALGRGFVDADGAEGSPRTIILSHALWTRRFGGDPAVIGRTVRIAGFPREVIGVMPPDVRFPDAPVGYMTSRADLWIPFDYLRSRGQNRGSQYLSVLGRLKPGVTPAMAERDLARVAAGFRREHPDHYAEPAVVGWRMRHVPLREQMVGSVRRPLLVIAGAVGLVLLIACVNIASLTLARGAARRREMAVRLALGARRDRIVRQLLTESAVLAVLGGALGVALAWAGVRLLVSLDPGSVPRLDATRIDGAALAFSLAASLVTGLLFGVAPALRQSRARLRDALGDGGRGTSDGRSRGRGRRALVAAEIAMALVVLVQAGLLVRSFAALQRVSPGFEAERVLTAATTLHGRQYDSTHRSVAFFERAVARVGALPGVAEASAVFPLPMSGGLWTGSLSIEGYETPPGESAPHAAYAVALPNYFKAMRIALLAGRDFTSRDAVGTPSVAVVDEVLARRYWPNGSPVGKRIYIYGDDTTTVIGVVRHVRVNGPQEEGEGQVYLAYLQRPQRAMALVARTAGDPVSLAPALRREIRALDPDLPVSKLRAMTDVVASATVRERFSMLLLVIFAGCALVLATVGLYGVMAYLVAQRTREIGIRLALGGSPRDVWRMVVREGLGIAVAGLVAGGAVSLALSGALAGLLHGVRPTDPVTYGTIAGLLLVVALAASYVPAWRATRVSPTEALRG